MGFLADVFHSLTVSLKILCKLFCSIIEAGGKIYTQIKIDEITNLGAVKVRLRSLLAALEQQERKAGLQERKVK